MRGLGIVLLREALQGENVFNNLKIFCLIQIFFNLLDKYIHVNFQIDSTAALVKIKSQTYLKRAMDQCLVQVYDHALLVHVLMSDVGQQVARRAGTELRRTSALAAARCFRRLRAGGSTEAAQQRPQHSLSRLLPHFTCKQQSIQFEFENTCLKLKLRMINW